MLQNPITCLVVDDEDFAVEMLTTYVERTPFLKLVHSTTDPLEAAGWLGANTVQLCITDVNMPGLNGLQLIDAAGGATKFILCTAHAEYALDGFNLDVLDYLLKPVTYPRFLKAAQKALQQIHAASPQPQDKAFFIRSKGKYLRFIPDEIFYVEGNKNYITVHTLTEKVTLHITMKEFLPMLPPGFLRVHNSFIIRLTAIKSLDGEHILLSTGQLIPLGPFFKQALTDALSLRF
jgi:DNA-binding LytR/AlgR family response regulator